MFTVDYTLDMAAARAALAAVLGSVGPDRKNMHSAMAQYVQMATVDYLQEEDGTSHKAAARLGAEPTRFFPKAAGFVKAVGSADGVSLTMPRAGLSRAFFPYVLVPVRSRLLTIPLKKESYGKRAREFKNLSWRRFSQEDVAEGKSDTAGLVLGKKQGGKGSMFIALFAGAKKVKQPQDRNILPSDDEWIAAAEIGLNEYLQALIAP